MESADQYAKEACVDWHMLPYCFHDSSRDCSGSGCNPAKLLGSDMAYTLEWCGDVCRLVAHFFKTL